MGTTRALALRASNISSRRVTWLTLKAARSRADCTLWLMRAWSVSRSLALALALAMVLVLVLVLVLAPLVLLVLLMLLVVAPGDSPSGLRMVTVT
jgi:hypothetical protein